MTRVVRCACADGGVGPTWLDRWREPLAGRNSGRSPGRGALHESENLQVAEAAAGSHARAQRCRRRKDADDGVLRIDWSEDHHDVAVVDTNGHLVAKQRTSDDAAGLGQLLGLLAEAGDGPDEPIPVAIQTARGLLVACLRATGRPVYAINPMAVARYRQRHAVSGKKSDHADALVLANILRTDLAAHRPLPADSELVRAIAVLARAQQDAVWDRTQAHNKLRSLLREYYPGFLAAFRDSRGGIMRPEARALLAAAPRRRRRPS